jgi:hypothetical protein
VNLGGSKAFGLVVALGVSAAASFPVDLRVTRTVAGVRLRLTVTDARTQATLRSFVQREQPMQLFVVGGSGLRVFRHEHPEQQRDGSFQADVSLSEPGTYMAFATFEPLGASPQWFQQAFTTGGMLPGHTDPADEPHAADGITATLDAGEARSGAEGTIAFTVEDDASGARIDSAHLFIASADLTEGAFLAAQGDGRGPRIAFTTLFPRPGRYKLWVELERASRITTIPFVIDLR